MKKKIDGCELAREAITAQSRNKDRALTAGSLHRRNRTPQNRPKTESLTLFPKWRSRQQPWQHRGWLY